MFTVVAVPSQCQPSHNKLFSSHRPESEGSSFKAPQTQLLRPFHLWQIKSRNVQAGSVFKTSCSLNLIKALPQNAV